MPIKTFAAIAVASTLMSGCNESTRVFDSEISAIRDQTLVLKSIDRHLRVIAETMKRNASVETSVKR